MVNQKGEQIEGYISKVDIQGKIYQLRCEVVEVHPIVCPKCGSSFELKYGTGQCPACGTWFATEFKLTEVIK